MWRRGRHKEQSVQRVRYGRMIKSLTESYKMVCQALVTAITHAPLMGVPPPNMTCWVRIMCHSCLSVFRLQPQTSFMPPLPMSSDYVRCETYAKAEEVESSCLNKHGNQSGDRRPATDLN